MTWALIAWSVLMLIWIIGGASSTNCGDKPTELEKNACEAGTGIGVTALFMLWFVGFVVLSLIWFMTRPRDSASPPPHGQSSIAAPPPPVASQRAAALPTPEAGWYPDPHNPGGHRWWDGRQWTETTSS